MTTRNDAKRARSRLSTSLLLACAVGCAPSLSACLYIEGGGGGAFPTAPSGSTAEATVAGAVGVTADIRTGPFARGLRLAAGAGTTHGVFALGDGEASYFTGPWHLRVDQTVWAKAPVYLRWMLAGELGGSASWRDARAEEAEPLDGTGFGIATGPSLTVGLEGEAERELASDGSVQITLAFHYARFSTSQGTVSLPGVQLRVGFDFDIGGTLAEGMQDGLN